MIRIIIDILLFILGYVISYFVNKYDINTYLKYIKCNKYIYGILEEQVSSNNYRNLSYEDYKAKIIEAITYELSLKRSIMDTDFNDFSLHVESYILKNKECLNLLKKGYEESSKQDLKDDEATVETLTEEQYYRLLELMKEDSTYKNNDNNSNKTEKVTLPNEVYDRDNDPLTDPFRM